MDSTNGSWRAGSSDDQLMAQYGIVAEGNQYRYGEFRYDKRADAIRYASHE